MDPEGASREEPRIHQERAASTNASVEHDFTYGARMHAFMRITFPGMARVQVQTFCGATLTPRGDPLSARYER